MGISIRGVGICLLAASVIAPVAAFAWQAATSDDSADRVRVSADGVRWSAEIEEPFFYSLLPWGPGEVRTAVLMLRNDAGEPADVTITVVCEAGDELVEHGALVVSAIVDDGQQQRFDADKHTNVVRVGTLEPDESATLTLRAELVSGTPEAQVVDSMGVRYRISGSGQVVEGGSPLRAADSAHLVLAPVFLGVALVLTAVVMSSPRGSRRSQGTSHR